MRDYIHVVNLAEGHLQALRVIEDQSGINVWNLGTGTGYSMLELVHAFEQASGQTVPYKVDPRRAGDIAECWADPSKALRELGWKAVRGLDAMMRDTWHWQSRNKYPGYGYATA